MNGSLNKLPYSRYMGPCIIQVNSMQFKFTFMYMQSTQQYDTYFTPKAMLCYAVLKVMLNPLLMYSFR